MSFENKTVDYINTLLVDSFNREFNTTFKLLPKSFIRVLSKVMAGVFITLYKQQGYIFLQLFVDTASFEEIEVLGRTIRPLVSWGNLVGVGDPGDATQWEGLINVTVTTLNSLLPEGTQLKSSSTGQVYFTTESKVLQNDIEAVRVKCAVSGTIGNLVIGDELTIVNALPFLEKKAVVDDIYAVAIDSETEGSYRARVLNRWRVQPQGGAFIDYRRWASEVSEVYNSYIYKDTESASGVLIYVSADPAGSRTVPSSVLVAVGNACTYDPVTGLGRKPIGAVLDPDNDGTFKNVRSVSETFFNVAVTGYDGDVGEFGSQAKTNVDAYFASREPYVRGLVFDTDKNDVIDVNNVIGILNDIAENLTGSFEGVSITLDGTDTPRYVLGQGEMSKLGEITVNGAPV